MPEVEFTIDELLARDENKRPSNPFKQLVAGVTDIGTGLPALAGIVGAGAQGGFNALTSDKGFKESFDEALMSGVDRSLLDIGLAGRENVNEFLGIKDPVSTEDQVARLIGGFAPVPIALPASLAGKIGTTALALTTPFVKKVGPLLSKGNVVRAGAQVGIGGALDQGIRAASGVPTLLSQEAVTGVPEVSFEFEEPFAEEIKTVDTLEKESDSRLILGTAVIGAALLGSFAAFKYLQKRKLDIAQPGVKGPEGLSAPPSVENRGLAGASRFLQKKFIDEGKAIDDAIIKSGRGGDDIESKLLQLEAQKEADPSGMALQHDINGRFGQNSNVQTASMRAIELELASSGADAAEREANKILFNQFVTAKTVKSVRIRADAIDIVKRVQRERGAFPELEAAVARDASPDDLEQILLTHAERVIEIRGTRPREQPSLWRNAQAGSKDRARPVSLDEINDIISRGNANPLISKLATDFFDNMDGSIRYLAERGVIRADQVDSMRQLVTVDGIAAFSPLAQGTQDNVLRRLAGMMGISTMTGRELNALRSLRERSVEGAGVTTPINPIPAARQYNYLLIDHANRNVFQYNTLSRIAGVELRDTGEGFALSRIPSSLDNADLIQDVHLIAVNDARKASANDPFSGVRLMTERAATDNVERELSQVPAIKNFFKNNKGAETLRRVFAGMGDESAPAVMVVQKQGMEMAFLVTDPSLVSALRHTKLSGLSLEVGGFFKRMFTRFTTGSGSLFAPISFVFQVQTAAITRALDEGLVAGARSISDSFRGASEIFRESLAREIAEQITVRLNTNTGISKLAPDHFSALRDRLEAVYRNSPINAIRAEAGRLSTGLASDAETRVVQVLQAAVPDVDRIFGANALPLIMRTWQTFNRAANEGTALGIAMRELKGTKYTPRQIREAVKKGKDAVGDVTRRGSSKFARAVAATVPFSGATIQSWNAIGSAMLRNPKKVVPIIAAVVGIPTVAELVWDQVMGMGDEKFTDDTGREWSYSDWYWNALNGADRANNSIYFVPGKPPWEAAIVPVSPEWSMFRSAVIEGMDALFNFSNVGIAGELGENGEHFLAAMTRVLDIPVPPPIAATLSGLGIDFRVGLLEDIQATSEGPVGRKTSFLKGTPTGSGERITAQYGRQRFTDSVFDAETQNILQDLFGSGASLYMAFVEGAHAGAAEGGALEGLERGVSSLGSATKQSFRYLNPLFGKALRPKLNDATNLNVLTKIGTLKALAKNGGLILSGGTLTSGGVPIRGIAPVTDDPIFNQLSLNANTALSQVKLIDKEIAFHKTQRASLGNATRDKFNDDKPITITERNDLIDLHTLEVKRLKAEQLKFLRDWENDASEFLTTALKRDVVVDLSDLEAKPNLGEGLILPARRKSDQNLP